MQTQDLDCLIPYLLSVHKTKYILQNKGFDLSRLTCDDCDSSLRNIHKYDNVDLYKGGNFSRTRYKKKELIQNDKIIML